jgi:GxxExxY protein
VEENDDIITIGEEGEAYHGIDLLYKEDTYKIIGACMAVHSELGRGFSEAVYKDALTYEFNRAGIVFEREKRYPVHYKGITLRNHYYCDFVIEDKIVLEAKSQVAFAYGNFKQVMNYLAVTRLKLGLLVNFGDKSLQYKRVVL